MVSSTAEIVALIDSITSHSTPPTLYFDLEGINLSRNGTISILQLLISPEKHVYLIDVHTLGAAAFTTSGSNGQTLRGIFSSPTISKVCFDIRNDSDALFNLFEVAVQGIQDLQLMENASRRPGAQKRFLNGLKKCIEHDAQLDWQTRAHWTAIKEEGARRFAPERGGRYEVFNERPLKEEIRKYCVQDVLQLPALHRTYTNRLTTIWKGRVELETARRVAESQSDAYKPDGDHKRYGPWPGM